MKTNGILCLILGLLLTGCSSGDIAPNQNIDALYNRFHGKYKVVSSISSEAVDVNFDGKASTDLIQEMPALVNEGQSYLELRTYGVPFRRSKTSFLCTQWWPEQTISVEADGKIVAWDWQPLAYDPALIVNYGMNGAVRSFSFSPNLDKLSLDPADYADNSIRWKRPESVTVTGDHTIEIVNRKTIYTRTGTKEVLITTRYERYTMNT